MSKYDIGCCIPGGSFMPQGVGEIDNSTYGILKNGYEAVIAAGYDFAEATVHLIMKLTEDEFGRAVDDGISFRVFNSFIPGSMPIISTAMNELESYVDRAMYRMKAFQAEGVIFGSGSARRLGGTDMNDDKIIEFIKMCDRLCDKYGLYLAIEPLNTNETDWVTSAADGYEMCKKLNLNNVKLLADAYHMACENEPPEILQAVQESLVHIHVSDADRKYPGRDGGAYLRRFASALKATSYSGGISAECGYGDFLSENKLGYEFMRGVF